MQENKAKYYIALHNRPDSLRVAGDETIKQDNNKIETLCCIDFFL